MLEETGETLCETRANVIGNGGKHVGNCRLREFLGHLVTSFQAALYIDRTTHKCRGFSNIFPVDFFSL